MYDECPDNDDRRTRDAMTDVVVRGVFAFTLAMAAAASNMADRRREALLSRQDPRLN